MSTTHIVGVDPGLVHTGVVRLSFDSPNQAVLIRHEAISGPDVSATEKWIESHGTPDHTYLEDYRVRSHFRQDKQMIKVVDEMRRVLPNAAVINNTGVKKVVKQPLMELLGVWKFSTVTNHQDLRSAARIALLGMLKDKELNRLLCDVVLAHLEGRDWDVVVA